MMIYQFFLYFPVEKDLPCTYPFLYNIIYSVRCFPWLDLKYIVLEIMFIFSIIINIFIIWSTHFNINSTMCRYDAMIANKFCGQISINTRQRFSIFTILKMLTCIFISFSYPIRSLFNYLFIFKRGMGHHFYDAPGHCA